MNKHEQYETKRAVLERYHALLAEGVQRFARPAHGLVSTQAGAAAEGPKGPLAEDEVARCASCRLCEGRARVVVQRPWRAAGLFVLAEAVSAEDESAPEGAALFAAEKSPSGVLNSLLLKLGPAVAAAGVHRAFAAKCLARKGLWPSEAATCASATLGPELHAVAPKVVLCFGARAKEAFLLAVRGEAVGTSVLDSGAGSTAGSGADSLRVKAAWGEVRAVFLPSALELDCWPEWRLGVWEALAFLRNAPGSAG